MQHDSNFVKDVVVIVMTHQLPDLICIPTNLSGNKTEPALIESFTHAALSRKAFTAQPYKNLVVCNFFVHRITGSFGVSNFKDLLPLGRGGEGISERTIPPCFRSSASISFSFFLENPVSKNSNPWNIILFLPFMRQFVRRSFTS
uniref:Uncharacterized protein n=1 Tax=Opuntia streptacantha TaxID=393608 RepID=A0A7C9FQQ4_OPUST